MTAATSNEAHRGREVENDLVEKIRAEMPLKRNVPVFSTVTKYDVVLNEDIVYAVALIKDYLATCSIKI